MTTLTLELSPHLLERLTVTAKQRQQPVEDLASSLLSESLTATSYPAMDERERVDQVLRESAMLVYLTDSLRARIDPTVHRADVIAALDAAGDEPLSQIVQEQRGQKG